VSEKVSFFSQTTTFQLTEGRWVFLVLTQEVPHLGWLSPALTVIVRPPGCGSYFRHIDAFILFLWTCSPVLGAKLPFLWALSLAEL